MLNSKKENVVLLGDFSQMDFEKNIWKTKSFSNCIWLLIGIFLIVVNVIIPRASAEENFLIFTLHLVTMATGVCLFFSTSIFLATKHDKLLEKYRLQKVFVRDNVLHVIIRKRTEDSSGRFLGYRIEKYVCTNIDGFKVDKSHIVVKGAFSKETIRPVGAFRHSIKTVHQCKMGRCLVKEKELIRYLDKKQKDWRKNNGKKILRS